MSEKGNLATNLDRELITRMVKGDLTAADFTTLRETTSQMAKPQLKSFRQALTVLDDQALYKFAVGFLEGHIKTEKTERGAPDDYVLEAPILLRQQDAGSLICKDCLQEIGRRHLKMPSSPNDLQAVRINPLLTSLYGVYKEQMEPIIQQMSEQGLKNKVYSSIKNLVEDTKGSLQRATPEQQSAWIRDNFRYLNQSNPEFEDKLREFIAEAVKPGADLSQLTKDLLLGYDLQANKKNISNHLLNHTIAYSLSFVVYKDLALKQIPVDASPEALTATVTQQGELAQPHGPYATALKAQDLVSQTKLPENYLQHQQNSQELEAKVNEVMAQMQNKPEKSKDETSVLDRIGAKIERFLHKIEEIFKSNKTNPPKEPEQEHFHKLQSSVKEAWSDVKSKAQKTERTAKPEAQYQPSLAEIKVSPRLYRTKSLANEAKSDVESGVGKVKDNLDKLVKYVGSNSGIEAKTQAQMIGEQQQVIKELKAALANKNKDVHQQRANKWQQIRAIHNRESSYNAR